MLQMRSYRETPKKCLSSSNYMKKMTQLCPFAWVQFNQKLLKWITFSVAFINRLAGGV